MASAVLSVRSLLFIAAAIGLAGASFANAAAVIGLPLTFAAPLGASFFSWRSDQARQVQQFVRGRSVNSAQRGANSGLELIQSHPLNPRALWQIGMFRAITGNPQQARQIIMRAEDLSRRDALVQLWLAEDAARRGNVDQALDHFNTLLIVSDDGRDEIIGRMADALQSPSAQRALAAYLVVDNPWRSRFLVRAADAGRSAEPASAMLLQAPLPLSADPADRLAYQRILVRLTAESKIAEALRLYRRLPAATSASLASVAAGSGAYQPFAWTFAENSNVTGETSSSAGVSGLDFVALPGTSGVAAIRYFEPRNRQRLRWEVSDVRANPDAQAHWVGRCVYGANSAQSSRSPNILSGLDQTSGTDSEEEFPTTGRLPTTSSGQRGGSAQVRELLLPQNCGLIRLEMFLDGGTGLNETSFRVANLHLR